MTDLRFSVFLARNGWAVYEVATKRVVEIDGVQQTGLPFKSAESSARRLNLAECAVGDSAALQMMAFGS